MAATPTTVIFADALLDALAVNTADARATLLPDAVVEADPAIAETAFCTRFATADVDADAAAKATASTYLVAE